MGFFTSLFGDGATDNISIEISQNIKGLLHTNSKFYMDPEEVWYTALGNVKAFHNWLIAVRDSGNIKEKTTRWIDLLIDEVAVFTIASKTYKELTQSEFHKLVTLSQVYAYCVQFQYIPLRGNMNHPTKKFYSEIIYKIYVKTLAKV
jgi:hypothetical protein